MKRILIYLLLPGLLSGCLTGRISDSGESRIPTTATFRIPRNIHAVELSQGVRAIITGDPGDRITIETDDEETLDRLRIRIDSGVLGISVDPKAGRTSDIHVTATLPDNGTYRALYVASGSRLTTARSLAAERLELRISSGAELDLEVRADTCLLETSSGAKARLHLTADVCAVGIASGSSAHLEGSTLHGSFRASSGSHIRADALATTDAEAEALSGSSIRLRCTERLRARASSGGSIRYTGDCRAYIGQSTGGNVRRIRTE